jgi:transcriptional regulator with XRE-family HTH domain
LAVAQFETGTFWHILATVADGSRSLGRQAAARAVKARRGQMRLSQQELAEQSGVARRTVQRLESGVGWAHSGTLAQLEAALDWPTGWLEEYAARADEHADRLDGDSQNEQLAAAERYLNLALEALRVRDEESDPPALQGG